jgi:hypothetical protein
MKRLLIAVTLLAACQPPAAVALAPVPQEAPPAASSAAVEAPGPAPVASAPPAATAEKPAPAGPPSIPPNGERCTVCEPPEPPPPEVKRLIALTERWLAAHRDAPVVVRLAESAPRGFVPYCLSNQNENCPKDRSDEFFLYHTRQRSLTINFGQAIHPGTTADEAQKLLAFVSIDRVPLPGLSVPGWDINPVATSSSFKEGVSVVNLTKRAIELHVVTEIFAIDGSLRGCRPPADAPTPARCFFHVEHSFTLDLTVKAPMFSARFSDPSDP